MSTCLAQNLSMVPGSPEVGGTLSRWEGTSLEWASSTGALCTLGCGWEGVSWLLEPKEIG